MVKEDGPYIADEFWEGDTFYTNEAIPVEARRTSGGMWGYSQDGWMCSDKLIRTWCESGEGYVIAPCGLLIGGAPVQFQYGDKVFWDGHMLVRQEAPVISTNNTAWLSADWTRCLLDSDVRRFINERKCTLYKKQPAKVIQGLRISFGGSTA